VFVERPGHLRRKLGALRAGIVAAEDRIYVRDKRIGVVLAAWAGYQIVTGHPALD